MKRMLRRVLKSRGLCLLRASDEGSKAKLKNVSTEGQTLFLSHQMGVVKAMKILK
jgi:hypothetical protein